MRVLLTRREVARRLNRPVDYVSGAIDALGLECARHGRAYVISDQQFKQLLRLRRKPARAAS